MERLELLRNLAHCLVRLSLAAQRMLMEAAIAGHPLPQRVRSEWIETERGEAVLAAFGGGVGEADFFDALALCDQSAMDRLLITMELRQRFLHSAQLPGHHVVENEAIYHSEDLTATLEWFRRVLGWRGFLEAWDEQGRGTYGLVLPQVDTAELGKRIRYVQLMRGIPCLGQAALFTKVWAVEALRQHILDAGWQQVGEISTTEWGARIFTVTTPDGALLQFYEPGRVGL